MNCERFQKNLFEYLDESLSPSDMAAARSHLGGCSVCRKVLQRELERAEAISGRLEQMVKRVTLEPHVQRAMVAAVEREIAGPHRPSPVSFWRRLALPFATAAALLMASSWVGYHFYEAGNIQHPTSNIQHPLNSGEQVLVHVAYSVPEYTFEQKDDTVIDALTNVPRVADGTLLVNRQEPTDQNNL